MTNITKIYMTEGDVLIIANGGQIVVESGAKIIASLPIADPGVEGQLWSNSGAVNVSTGGGGGGTAPAWVPEGAKIYIDLLNDRAWTEAGAAAVNTLLGSDPNTENAWGVTEYDPANLTGDGYAADASSVAFIGAARTAILDAATVAVRFKNGGLMAQAYSMGLVSADGVDAIEIDLNTNSDLKAVAYSWGGDMSIATDAAATAADDAINVVAFTVTGSRVDLAVNGSSAVTGACGEDDRPSANPLVAAFMQAGRGKAIQSITIYDALPDTAGLSDLSAL